MARGADRAAGLKLAIGTIRMRQIRGAVGVAADTLSAPREWVSTLNTVNTPQD